MEQLITLNIIALTRLARAAAPASVSRGVGTIVNISSIVAINPELLNGVDGGGNAIVLAFPHRLTMKSQQGIRV